MFIRHCVFIVVMMLCAYGALISLNSDVTPYAYMRDWRYFAFLSSPWLLALMSLKSWHRCFVWRRMLDNRHTSPEFSRGGYHFDRQNLRPGVLEYGCVMLFLLAIASIMKQFAIPYFGWWVAAGTSAFFVLRLIINRSQ